MKKNLFICGVIFFCFSCSTSPFKTEGVELFPGTPDLPGWEQLDTGVEKIEQSDCDVVKKYRTPFMVYHNLDTSAKVKITAITVHSYEEGVRVFLNLFREPSTLLLKENSIILKQQLREGYITDNAVFIIEADSSSSEYFAAPFEHYFSLMPADKPLSFFKLFNNGRLTGYSCSQNSDFPQLDNFYSGNFLQNGREYRIGGSIRKDVPTAIAEISALTANGVYVAESFDDNKVAVFLNGNTYTIISNKGRVILGVSGIASIPEGKKILELLRGLID